MKIDILGSNEHVHALVIPGPVGVAQPAEIAFPHAEAGKETSR